MNSFPVVGLSSLSVKAQVTWTKQNKFGGASRIVAGFEIKRKVGGDFPGIIKDYVGTHPVCFDHI